MIARCDRVALGIRNVSRVVPQESLAATMRTRHLQKKTATQAFDAKAFLAKVGTGKTFPKFAKGRIIFDQGDQANSVYYIQSGRVKITVLSPAGKEAVVALLGPTDFFGEGCLAGQQKRTATVVVLDDCAVVKIDKNAIINMLHDESEFSAIFVTHLLARSIRVEEDLIDQLFNSSEKRKKSEGLFF